MSSTDSEQAKDDDLIAWGNEVDEIMTVAVENAIEENKRLGLHADPDEPPKSSRVAEGD